MTGHMPPMHLVADRLNHYAGTVHHHHDGDTVYCLVWDPIQPAWVLKGVRIRGTQANELKEPGGPEAAAAVMELLPVNSHLILGEVGRDAREGRIVASITTQAGIDVATWLVERRYAVRWDGTGKRPTVPWPPTPRED